MRYGIKFPTAMLFLAGMGVGVGMRSCFQTALCANKVWLSENNDGKFWCYVDVNSASVDQLYHETKNFEQNFKIYQSCLCALESGDIAVFCQQVLALQKTDFAAKANSFLIAICVDTANVAAFNVMRTINPTLADEIKADRVWGGQVRYTPTFTLADRLKQREQEQLERELAQLKHPTESRIPIKW